MEQEIQDLATEEFNSAANNVEKDMLLQKYGVIEPKLTPEEKAIIELEATGITRLNGIFLLEEF